MQKYQDSSLSPEERASDLLARMNLDEKFGQIQCYNAIDSFLGKSVEKQNPYGVGQVCILIATMLLPNRECRWCVPRINIGSFV